jgi:hypothetical protein
VDAQCTVWLCWSSVKSMQREARSLADDNADSGAPDARRITSKVACR